MNTPTIPRLVQEDNEPQTYSSLKINSVPQGLNEDSFCIDLKGNNQGESKRSRREVSERKRNYDLPRRLWKEYEDKAIVSLVKQYGIKNWSLVSHKLQEDYKIFGRSGKQCRER